MVNFKIKMECINVKNGFIKEDFRPVKKWEEEL
jgi:hypothetical protein